MADPDSAKQRVAVIGSGITGLSAAWLLQKCDNSIIAPASVTIAASLLIHLSNELHAGGQQ